MEDTKMTQDTENLAHIEDMLRNAQRGEEPGDMVKNPVISKGDGDTPPMVALPPVSAGYTIVYDTRTFVPRLTNNNMLRAMLKKTRPDKSYVNSLKQLGTPRIGTFKCLLHQSDPNREHYDYLGLAVCPKGNLASPYQVRRHMLKKHKVEWAAIEEERIDKEKKEDREFQRMLISRAMPEEKAPLYVKDKVKIK